MTQDELLHILALLKIEGIGDVIAKKLINHCGSATNVFNEKANKLSKIDGIGSVLLKNLKDKTAFFEAEREIKNLEKKPCQIYYYQDNNYPDKLKHCIDAPVLLFGKGQMSLKQQKIISIVGTRNITSYGQDFIKQFLEDLAPLNPLIVSGFAYGVDIYAHKTALDLGLQTIGVFAHGLDVIYPKTHQKYVNKIEENGGFLTEFWTGTQPDKENFVKRNRIVAGISEASVVVESAEKGGSMITANYAREYYRDVFAVPGRVSDKMSQGCNNLIKTQRAQLITNAADLIYCLNWDIKESPKKTIQKQLFVELNEKEQAIYDFLIESGKKQLDDISLECQIPVFQLSSILLQMELQGVIRPLPGKLFEAI